MVTHLKLTDILLLCKFDFCQIPKLKFISIHIVCHIEFIPVNTALRENTF